MLAQVFVIGNVDVEHKNCRRGRGLRPAGGTHGTPAANINSSSKVTELASSKSR